MICTSRGLKDRNIYNFPISVTLSSRRKTSTILSTNVDQLEKNTINAIGNNFVREEENGERKRMVGLM